MATATPTARQVGSRRLLALAIAIVVVSWALCAAAIVFAAVFDLPLIGEQNFSPLYLINAFVYAPVSALLIARQAFEARRRLADEIAALRARVAERQTIVRAVAALCGEGTDDDQAYAQLRSLAMNWQVSIEDAARRIVAMTRHGGEDDERSRRA